MKEVLLFVCAVLASLPLLISRPMSSLSPPNVAAVPTVALQVPLTPTPATVEASTPRPLPPVPTPAVGEASGGLIQQAIAFALTWLHVPYLWAGCSRGGVDCSCFVLNVLASIGITAPRTTVTQVVWARPVSRDQLQPLDLVFFDDTCPHAECGANPTHVGLYLGGGQMVQAGGAAVSVQPLFSGFYGAHFARAGRAPGL